MIGWKPTPFIFVHIPKCAGTSVEQALIPIATSRNNFNDLSEKMRTQFWLPGVRGLQHAKLKRFERYFPLEDFFKFTFVRNPWDRAVSQIEFLRSRIGSALFPSGNFKENLRIYCNTTKNVWEQDLGASQWDFLQTKSGNGVNFVGRYESLKDDFRKVCTLLEISPVPELPWAFNSQRVKHYSAYYDSESVNWIKDRFAKDIDNFCYKFESPQKDV